MTTEFKELADADLAALQSRLTSEFHRRDIVKQLKSVTQLTVDTWFKYVKEHLQETTGSGKNDFNRHFGAIKHFATLGLATYNKDTTT